MIFLKHENFKDVAISVGDLYSNGDILGIRGEWFNMSFTKTYAIGENLKFRIKKEDLKNWLICLEPDKECIRYSKWGQFNGRITGI